MKKILLASTLTISSLLGFAQEVKTDINELIEDTQINLGEQGEIKMAWWIPTEFWRVTFENEPGIPAEEVDNFMKTLEPYSIFAVVEGEIGNYGGVNYTPLETLESSLSLTGSDGKTYKSLLFTDLSADMRSFLSMFRPILVNMIGQLGENMHFFVFDDITSKGLRISDPYANGSVTLKCHNEEYKWRTPLGSLLAPKYCPVDNEEMSGAWKYCPFHGDELKEK